MNRALLIALICWLLTPSSVPAGDTGVFLFRYANAQNKTDPRSVSMEFFKKELVTRTGRRIKVENYFGGILGTEREMADAVGYAGILFAPEP